MSMPMKTRFRVKILPLAACGALALMGACFDATAPQPTAASQSRSGFVPTRTDFGGYLGTGKDDTLENGAALQEVLRKRVPAPVDSL